MKNKLLFIMARIATFISPKLYIRLSYFHSRHRWPNLKEPKDVSEIILSTMYSGKVNEYSDYVDKLKVREIYKDWGYEEYLPKIYGVWDTPEEIEFEKLPNSFALKTNHGCGHHYICRDKRDLNIELAKKTINSALNMKFGLAETQYHSIEPKVYCEEFIDDGTGELPSDYKFLCVDGEIKSILVVTERKGTSYKLLTYDTNWNKLNYVTSHYQTDYEFARPNNLDLMIKIAKEIANNFEFVRVDFYDLGDRILLGELTFTPQGGIMSYFTDEAIKKMGRF